ncbi:hypothetical protein DPMN_047072 [Dreissena polymorpha]|uniref:Uncharacterized protein n=1 Tax=Dreissena polymorpha TaxID=45954 RepID=A0A9D4I2T2_DREPO|nr:hypothetical protein DPMN_047072 [Dreissena polymorpha]
MVRSAPILIDKPTQTQKQNLSRLNHGAVATHTRQITAQLPVRLGAEITPVSVSHWESYAKSEVDQSAVGQKRLWFPSTLVLHADSFCSGRSDFGLCQPKNPGMTCDRR